MIGCLEQSRKKNGLELSRPGKIEGSKPALPECSFRNGSSAAICNTALFGLRGRLWLTSWVAGDLTRVLPLSVIMQAAHLLFKRAARLALARGTSQIRQLPDSTRLHGSVQCTPPTRPKGRFEIARFANRPASESRCCLAMVTEFAPAQLRRLRL